MSDAAATERARAYLAVFLPPDRADELSQQIAAELDRGAETPVVLAAAHRRLGAEVRVADEVAADVLVRDLGMEPEEVAGILGVPAATVLAAVDEARTIEEELGGGPAAGAEEEPSPSVQYVFDTDAPPEPEPRAEALVADRERPGRRRGVLAPLVVLLVVAAAVLAVVVASGDGATDGEVTITEIRTTGEMGSDGPGPERDLFAPGDQVIVWFAYEPVGEEATVQLVVLRDGTEVISPAFPLPRARTDSHVTLPLVVVEEPGSYRLELRGDERVLAEDGFRVEAQ